MNTEKIDTKFKTVVVGMFRIGRRTRLGNGNKLGFMFVQHALIYLLKER